MNAPDTASPNAPALVDVLGTWMLSILDGHCRYAHVGALRGDGVAPSILGMSKIIGDDSLRRALSAIAQATTTPWILDCETTIKPLYGKQDGAVVSYNLERKIG